MSTYTEESIVDQVTAQWVDPVPADPDSDLPAKEGRWVINVRKSERVVRTGRKAGERDSTTEVIKAIPHRHVVELDADLKDEDPIVQKVAAAIAPTVATAVKKP